MTKGSKQRLFAAVAIALACAVPYLMAEGIYSLVKGADAATSFSYAAYQSLFVDRAVTALDPRDPNTWMITDVRQIQALIAPMKASGVGLGNSPFSELKGDDVAINREEGGCLVQKPNLRKTMSYLRSNLFNPFDQMTYFYDAERTLPPEVAAFFDRYGFRRVQLTTNEHGERLTLPRVEAADIVLVAGDSVANGVMLDDAETLASQLQAADAAHRYVNLGIARAAAADVLCALDRAATRYAGHIREIIYVFCENDFDDTLPYGTPATLSAALADRARQFGVERVVFLYVPYIYNVAPEITRIRGHTHRAFPTYSEPKRELLRLVAAAGFSVVDFLDIANEQRTAGATQFAPLALYVDHTHMSPLGVARVVARITALGTPAAVAED